MSSDAAEDRLEVPFFGNAGGGDSSGSGAQLEVDDPVGGKVG